MSTKAFRENFFVRVRDRRMERPGGRFDSPTVRERPNKNFVKTRIKTRKIFKDHHQNKRKIKRKTKKISKIKQIKFDKLLDKFITLL